jgi:hypothetical protein
VIEDLHCLEAFMFEKVEDHELHVKMKNLALKERELLYEVLLHIAEVDKRKLYLSMAFPSLWKYLLSLGYSEESAQRRIQGARLLQRAPEVAESMEKGSINLSQACELQTALKHTQSSYHLPKLIKDIENKSKHETKVILAQALELPIQTVEKQKPQADESIRVEMTFTKEQWERLQKVKQLHAHALEDQSLASVIDHLAAQALKKSHKSTASAKVILNRDKFCQFLDPVTQRQCKSTHFLQVDHIQPKWAGGSDDPSNLRILCGQHNRFRYQQQALARKNTASHLLQE